MSHTLLYILGEAKTTLFTLNELRQCVQCYIVITGSSHGGKYILTPFLYPQVMKRRHYN